MITTIIIMSLAFSWLGYETDWMRIRLPIGDRLIPKYARYEVYQGLKKRTVFWGDLAIYEGYNCQNDERNGEPTYYIFLSPGVKSVLCGWDWLNEHCADMVDYQPKVEMNMGGVRYNMTIKQPSIIKDIMKANKLTRKQKLAYA